MASIPVACFSASKVHEHVKAKFAESTKEGDGAKIFRRNIFEIDIVLANYNSKLMNSIWGQYNLYASHAFQKNSEGSTNVDFLHIPQVKYTFNSFESLWASI